MEYRSIKFGDGKNFTKGWLVITGGAVRGVLLEHENKILLHFSYDKAIQTRFSHALFNDWQQATAWLEERLEPMAELVEPVVAPKLPGQRERASASRK